MKTLSLFLVLMTVAPLYAKEDKSASYQMGTFVFSSIAADGTITSTLHGDGTTTAGSVHENHLAVYMVKMADGFWHLETYTQNKDSMIRQMGMTPMHFKSEKDNPLDLLKGGERVLFRIEKHKLLNGVELPSTFLMPTTPTKNFVSSAIFIQTQRPFSLKELATT